jgi:hypothetical protein
VWERSIDGRRLTFHLAGINNQNFLMRDEETGSFWQQISGKAISGPLAGRQLELIHSDELTFGLWKQENPNGDVLLPVARYAEDYEPKDWEKSMGKAKTVVDTSQTGIAPRELMLGLTIGNASRAYPHSRVLLEKLILDRPGGQPVLLVLGPDDTSVRAFRAAIPGESETPDFYRPMELKSGIVMLDGLTGSEWDFRGCAISGPAQGRCLPPLTLLKDYWFDWRTYHPDTTVYGRALNGGQSTSASPAQTP